MEYNKIIAVTGLPGLYELLSSKTDGAIVRSLEDKSTRFVSSRIHNFSHLESIEVYTVRDNVNLADILKAMEASPEKLPDEKDNASLRSYFGKVYPDIDFDRVYSSDLKKMVKWFAVLKENNIEVRLSEPEEETDADLVEAETPKKAAPAAPKEKATAATPKEAAPKEKAAPVAPKETKTPAPAKKTEKSEKPSAKAKEVVKEKPKAKKETAPAKKSADKEKKPAAAAKPGKPTKKKK
jgi:hypothetical protein